MSNFLTDHARKERLANGFVMGALVLVVLAVCDRARRNWVIPEKRCLLIHADDAGLCSAVNRATEHAMDMGAVSSASIMVPCPGFEEFAEYARTHPDKDFGLHLTLTSEWDDVRWGPVSPPLAVPSLMDSEGMLWRTADRFAQHAVAAEVETEIRAQIQRARNSGIILSHLDNHMNSLFQRPDLMELLVRISREESLPIRFSKQLPTGWEDVLPGEVVDAYYDQLKVLWEQQNPLADFIEADNYQAPAAKKREYLLHALRGLAPGVTELVIHCCEPEAKDWIPPDGPGRQSETMVMCSPEVSSEIHLLGVRVIDWKQFRRMCQDNERRHW